ncbi:MAG: hypothetical protein FJ272_14090, partial [Planctomycetes bacterium]|nr:hypothetical protein [Planctomycetota bacterium]
PMSLMCWSAAFPPYGGPVFLASSPDKVGALLPGSQRHRAMCLAAVLALMCRFAIAADMREEYVSDSFKELVVESRQDWGRLGLDTAVVPTDGRTPQPLRIGEKTYAKGLGHHANGEITLSLEGRYKAFKAEVGVLWQGGRRGSVVFQILADGQKRFESGKMSDSDAPQAVDVSLEGVRELRLVLTNAGDGISHDAGIWAEARLVGGETTVRFGQAQVTLNGQPAPPLSASVAGFALVAGDTGPQVAILGATGAFAVSVCDGEDVEIALPILNAAQPFEVTADATTVHGKAAEVSLSVDGTCSAPVMAPPVPYAPTLAERREPITRPLRTVDGETARGEGTASLAMKAAGGVLRLKTRAGSGESTVRWERVRLRMGDRSLDVPMFRLSKRAAQETPPRVLPALRPGIERALIEWDWRMQDGLGTERAPSSYLDAVERTLKRGDDLIRELQAVGVDLSREASEWEALRSEWQSFLRTTDHAPRVEDLWRRVHVLRRAIALKNPLAQFGPLLFVKQVPSVFSHQLTQYYGSCAKPGGGVFVLHAPGQSMQCRQLAASLPMGSYQHPEVSSDGQRVLFAYCHAETAPPNRETHLDRFYHLHEMAADGSGLRQLTDGPFDDFSPRYLPDGRIVFISTRRGGFHRCGRGPCPTYTLALANPDGSNPRPISFHETHEWDPAVLNDGRVIYTRWDYVDRGAVFYQQLWTVRPDGSDVRAFYGNNTYNPVGVWEARPVPGSRLVMAT